MVRFIKDWFDYLGCFSVFVVVGSLGIVYGVDICFENNVEVDIVEVYFFIMYFLFSGLC